MAKKEVKIKKLTKKQLKKLKGGTCTNGSVNMTCSTDKSGCSTANSGHKIQLA